MKNKEQSDATTSGQCGPRLRVWGGPQQAVFVACGHESIACHLAESLKIAQKNRGSYY